MASFGKLGKLLKQIDAKNKEQQIVSVTNNEITETNLNNLKQKKYTVERNEYLNRDVIGFYNRDYIGYEQPNNPDFINVLKNTFNTYDNNKLNNAMKCVFDIFRQDLPNIIKEYNIDTICVVPRSKANFQPNQMLFKRVVDIFINKFIENENVLVENGIDYIQRHTNTKTTHLTHSKKGRAIDNDGDMPYIGITKNTCHVSDNVKGKNILLIDDIYTKTVNIDEDCIQALFDYGAKNVILYTIAKTIKKQTVVNIEEPNFGWDTLY